MEKNQKAEVNTTGTSSSFECDKTKKIDYFWRFFILTDVLKI